MKGGLVEKSKASMINGWTEVAAFELIAVKYFGIRTSRREIYDPRFADIPDHW